MNPRNDSVNQCTNQRTDESVNHWMRVNEPVNQWNVKNSMNQWTSDRTNKWIDEWMDGWMDGWMDELHTSSLCLLTSSLSDRTSCLSYFSSEQPLIWASSLTLLWAASQLATRIIWNQLTMHLATSSCSPACQERRSITERFAPRSLANRSCHSQLQIRI